MKCTTCNKPLTRPLSQTFKNNFCDHVCYAGYKMIQFQGDKNPRWKGGENNFKCKTCGKTCRRRKTGKINPKFCSLKCYHIDKSKQMTGNNHWNWKGGESIKAIRNKLRKEPPRPKPERCEVCNELGSNFKKGLCLDHNHQTNKFRGWLCTNCNTALGLTKDNPLILEKLIKYLAQ